MILCVNVSGDWAVPVYTFNSMVKPNKNPFVIHILVEVKDHLWR
jgi:hypothetical protein